MPPPAAADGRMVGTNVEAVCGRANGEDGATRMSFLADTPAGGRDAAVTRRIAANQATLRRLNDGIEAERPDGLIAFRCECGQLGCNRLVPLRREQYEAVRADSRRFVIAPGHVVAELEHLVERHAEHAVVETHPHTSEFA